MISNSDLYTNFLTYYKEFALSLKIEKKKKSFCCFGLTGAGKSVFVARLKSNKSIKEFYDIITLDVDKRENLSKGFVDLDGVKIGLGTNSTTITPQYYDIDDVRIYDMPGFNDTDPNKRMIIGILQKCFLNKVKDENIYLIILNGKLFFDHKLDNAVNNYCETLESLFHSNFKSFLDKSYFIITNNDKLKYTKDSFINDLDKHQKRYRGDIKKINMQTFLQRMEDNMMFVDYSNQSGIDLLKELKILTNYDKEEDLILNNKINKDNYTIHEIEMNKYLENDLEDLYQNTNLKYDNFCNKIKLFETELTNLEKKIKKVYEDYNVTQTQKKKIEMNIQDYTNINNSFEENRNSKKNEMIRLEKDAQYQVEVINLVKKRKLLTIMKLVIDVIFQMMFQMY